MNKKFILGTVKLGEPSYGFSLNKREDVAENFLDECINRLNINHLDTSERYGNSENLISNFLKNNNNDIIIDTKIDNLYVDKNDIEKQVIYKVSGAWEKFGKNLSTLYLHQNELSVISNEKILNTLTNLKNDKVFKAIGVSVYDLRELDFALNSSHIDVVQIPVNIASTKLYKYCKTINHDKIIIGRSILLQGLLLDIKFINTVKKKYHKNIYEFMSLIEEICIEYKLSIAELCLRFVASLKNIDSIILGSTNLKNIENSIHSINQKFSVNILNRVLELSRNEQAWNNPRNW